MKIMIKANINDEQYNKLKNMGYDINYPFTTNISLDYGDKVLYCNGKVQPKSNEKLLSY